MQSRSRMLARMQKQTSRAQHRTNIRERYGLQPDMLDTGIRFYLSECLNRSFYWLSILVTFLVTGGDRRVQAGPRFQNRFETHHENSRIDQLINIVHLTAEQTA